MEKRKKLIAIAGPTCGGKTTLRSALVEGWPTLFQSVLTTTSRPKRRGESDGVDYHFCSAEEFEQRKKNLRFIENITVSGHQYGVDKQSLVNLLKSDLNGVVVVTPDGLPALQRWCDDAQVEIVSVFATAPLSVLYQRLRDRRVVTSENDFEVRRAELALQAHNWRKRWHYDIQAISG